MSLDLPQLLPQLQAAGRSAAAQARALRERLPQAQEALDQAGQLDPDELRHKVQLAGGRWSGARPSDEDPSGRFDPPAAPAGFDVLAADGSQIYPDRHAGVLYYLINIGGLRLRHGSGAAPETFSRPQLYHEPADLYNQRGQLIASEWINGRRDVAEMAALAELAASTRQVPTLALLDNGLILWILLQGRDQTDGQAQELLDQYLAQLGKLQATDTAVAGVVDRPRSASVLALAQLAGLSNDSISEEALQANPFHGLSDRALFQQRLTVGQRSALFVHGTPVNDRFRAAGHEVSFFYLKTTEETLLRVEVPAWVAKRPESMDLGHAGLLAEGQTTGGFPYSLARAHEIAVVSNAERTELERRLTDVMLQHGIQSTRSQKSHLKRWSGGRRRHRP